MLQAGGGVFAPAQAISMDARDRVQTTGTVLYHALMMQAAQRPTPAAISDVTCPPGKLYMRRAWAQLECCGFRGGTCLAVGELCGQMVRCMGRDKKTECGVMRLWPSGPGGQPAPPELSMLSGCWLLVVGSRLLVVGCWSARPVPAQRVFSRLELHASRPLPFPPFLLPRYGHGHFVPIETSPS